MHHRREIAAEQKVLARIAGLAEKGNHGMIHVAEIHPVETGVMKIHFIHRRVSLIELVQLGHHDLQLAMVVVLQQLPAHAGIVVPLLVLPDVATHE